jgi:hypothetical protein
MQKLQTRNNITSLVIALLAYIRNDARIVNFCDRKFVGYLSLPRIEGAGTRATDVEIVSTASYLGCDVVIFAKYMAKESVDYAIQPVFHLLKRRTQPLI